LLGGNHAADAWHLPAPQVFPKVNRASREGDTADSEGNREASLPNP
jgi:hypothetical protein